MEQEVWKDIKGYEGLYQVSNSGRVKSFHHNKEKILKGSANDMGYLHVGLNKNGKCKFKMNHRLVAEAFIPNQNNLPFINHKDCNPLNNQVDNLEWCDQRYNVLYDNANQKKLNTRTANNSWNKPIKIAQLDDDNNIISVFNSSNEAKEKLGISHTLEVCRGKRKRAGGYKWKFI